MQAEPELEYRLVPVTRIAPHPANPRSSLGGLGELTPSIQTLGVLIAPVVIPAGPVAALWPDHAQALAGKEWVLLSGHRRLAALTQTGLAQTAVAVDKDVDGDGHDGGDGGGAMVTVAVRRDGLAQDRAGQLAFMRADNIARAPLTPMDEARSFQQALAAGLSQRQIARASGCSQPHVSRRLALTRLPIELQSRIDSGELAIQDGLRLAELDGHEAILGAWRLLADAGPDGWITTAGHAVEEYTTRRTYQARKAASLARAADTGTELVDPTETFGPGAAARRLEQAADIEAARARGVLVAAVNSDGDLDYYSTTPPAQPDPPRREQHASAGITPQLRAMHARERAALTIASVPPQLDETAADIVDAYIDTADAASRRLARRWLTALHPALRAGADLPHPTWWQRIRAAEWRVRVHAAHVLALAHSELALRTHAAWNQDDRTWLRRLIDQAKYTPSTWEHDRLRDPTETRR